MILSTKSKVTITLAILVSVTGASAFAQVMARPAPRPAETMNGLKEGRAGEKMGETSELQALLKRRSISGTASADAKLAKGLNSTDAKTLKATRDFLNIFRGDDAAKKSAALKAINAYEDLSGAWATFQAGAGQVVSGAVASTAAVNHSEKICTNGPVVPLTASKILNPDHLLKDCGLSADAANVAIRIAEKVQADGTGANDAQQFAEELRKLRGLTLAEAIAGVKKIFGDCINGTPGFNAQVQAL